MGEENTNAVNTTTLTNETNTTKKKKNLIPIIIAVAVIAAILGAVLYFTSDGVKRNKAMEEGDRYLSGLQYEQALAQYQVALNIDAKRQERSDDVNQRIQGLISTAEDFIGAEDYEGAIKTVAPILLLSSSDSGIKETIQKAEEITKNANNKLEGNNLLEQADLAFEEGRYKEAEELYDQVILELEDETIVTPKRELSINYQKLIELWEAGDYTGVAKYVDSNEADDIIKYMDTENPQYIKCKDNLIVSMKDDMIYVMGGELTQEKAEGKELVVISGINCYAIYSGIMKDNIPDGEGEVAIWDKNVKELDITGGTVFKGDFSTGLADGVMLYSNKDYKDIPINMNKGQINIVKTDEQGRLWITDIDTEEHFFFVNNDSKWMDDYQAGVPGYGGNEKSFVIFDGIIDREPPTFSYSVKVGDRRFNPSDIHARDNIDSNVDITYKKTTTGEWWDGVDTYVFTATDDEGNTAKLTVAVQFEDDCGDMTRTVISIK